MYFDVNDETASSTQAAVTEISNGLNNNINSSSDVKNPASSSPSGMSGEDDFISRSRLSSKTSSTTASSEVHHSHSSPSPLSGQDINFNTAAATSASINESQSALTQRQEPNVVNCSSHSQSSPSSSSSSSSSPATQFHSNNSSAQVCAYANSNANSDDGSSSLNHTPVNTAVNINTILEAHKGRESANISSQSQRHELPPPPKLIFSSETPPPLPISHPPTTSDANLSGPRVEFVLGDDSEEQLIDVSDANQSADAAGGEEMQRLLRKTSKMRHSHSSSEVMMTNGFELPGPATATSTTATPTPKPKVSVTAPKTVLDVNSNSHCSSLLSAEESFECMADGRDSFVFDSPSENTSLQLQYTTARDANDLSLSELAGPSTSNRVTPTSGLPFRRNSALRTSLRKSPQDSLNGDMGHRRWGSFRNPSGTKRPLGTSTPTSSNALATQLYRTGSFNSTGRSSTGDPEEMYSDGSLEDEVIDLTQKVHHLEEKFTVLAENQSDVDDRYSRAKQENSELTTKLFLLEEQLRDVEQRAEDKIRDEQKRSKEALARLDREKQLQIENYDIRLQGLEKELQQTKNESARQKQMLERERTERIQASDKLYETEREIVALRDDNRNLMEQARKERESLVAETVGSQQALQDLRKEFEHLRQFQMANLNGSLSRDKHGFLHRESLDGDINEIRSRLLELEEENKHLKQQNRRLEETNEDLTAQILNHGLEEGRHLLTLGPRDMGNSLAAEFEAMSEDQMKTALKEQKEVNEQLRCYIDGILLNIVENYPQLLEVKNKSHPHDRPQTQLRRES